MKDIVVTHDAPRGAGPYSQGVKVGNLVFTSGQGPIDPATNKVVQGSLEEQARLTLSNVKAILLAAGSDLSRAVKVTVYLKDMQDFPTFNNVYKEFFTEPYPCRTAIGADLPAGFNVEVDCIATLD